MPPLGCPLGSAQGEGVAARRIACSVRVARPVVSSKICMHIVFGCLWLETCSRGPSPSQLSGSFFLVSADNASAGTLLTPGSFSAKLLSGVASPLGS